MDFFPSAPNASVSALQTALNRFATRMGKGLIAVDGLIGPQTFERLQQVIVLFVPIEINSVWTATGLITYDDVVTYAQDFANAVNAAADSWGGALATAPSSAERENYATALAAQGAPGLGVSSAWLWVGGLALATAVVGWVYWKRRH